MAEERSYIAIDLKSFYASVECAARGFDPLTTNLVVADVSRTEKTICLAVSPSLKSYGIPGRARLFEVNERVREVNAERKRQSPSGTLLKGVYDNERVKSDPYIALDFIAATPRMAKYLEVSTEIYNIYLRYIAPEDIHVYSIDEVFIDVTGYLKMYRKTPREIAMMLIREVLKETGITATAGVGTNLYLAKVAMDIVAKHIPADENGVRMACLDEMSYRRTLWDHTPITDFWRIGRGYERRLAEAGLYTMGDIARASVAPKKEYVSEDLLYSMFGVNAELLIDHAWGWEPVTIKEIKEYKPSDHSLSSGQVLHTPYEYEKAGMVLREMAETLSLDLVEKKLVADQIAVSIGYDTENVTGEKAKSFDGVIDADWYGRKVPKGVHGSQSLPLPTSSTRLIVEAANAVFERIANKKYTVRRLGIAAMHVRPESGETPKEEYEQMDLFTDYEKRDRENEDMKKSLLRERGQQEAILEIQKKFGKNAIVKGTDLTEGATRMERNAQIGGHKA